MTDARFPERWLNDRRVVRLSDAAHRLFVTALAWSASNRTDGLVERTDLVLVHGVDPGRAGELVAAGLWNPETNGWLMVDFLTTQTTAAQLAGLDHKRQMDRERQARCRAKVASADEPKDSPVTRDVTRDVAGGTKARPVPVPGQQLEKEVAQEVEQADQPDPDPALPHRCSSCNARIRFRNGMCKTCSGAVIAANSSLRSEPDPDKSTPKPNGDVSDDPDREFRRAI